MRTGRDDPDTARKRLEEGARDIVEEASADSFPASDPPAWAALNAGSPAPVAKGTRTGSEAREPETDPRQAP